MLVNNHLGGTCSRTLSSCGRSPLDPQVGSINLFVHVAHFHVLMYFHRGLSFPAIFVVKGHQRPPSCKPASQTQRVTHQEHGLGGTKCLTTACGFDAVKVDWQRVGLGGYLKLTWSLCKTFQNSKKCFNLKSQHSDTSILLQTFHWSLHMLYALYACFCRSASQYLSISVRDRKIPREGPGPKALALKIVSAAIHMPPTLNLMTTKGPSDNSSKVASGHILCSQFS